MMTSKPILLGAALTLAALTLAGCEKKAAEGASVAQGSAPQGTISDELPDLEMLPNDAPLADPADVPPVPGLAGDAAAAPTAADAPAATSDAPAPAAADPIANDSLAE